METHLIETIGYCGTFATVATYSMRSIVSLRIAGIASSLFFIAYASIMGVWPMLLTEFIILPINCLRLFQALRRRDAGPIDALASCQKLQANAAMNT